VADEPEVVETFGELSVTARQVNARGSATSFELHFSVQTRLYPVSRVQGLPGAHPLKSLFPIFLLIPLD
jgi:hypothetical protein